MSIKLLIFKNKHTNKNKEEKDMNKKTIKILSIIIMAIMVISISVNSFAALDFAPNQVEASGEVTGKTEIQNLGNSIVGILQTVGVVLSVVVLIILGIKYMMGSSEEKAEYKKTMIPYIVGAALIFTASVLANVVFQFFTGIGTK